MNEPLSDSQTQRKSGAWLPGVGLVVLALSGFRTIAQADFWLRLAMGRAIAAQGIPRGDVFTFTAAGRPWTNCSWLYDRLLYALWNLGGAPLLVLLHVAVGVGAFALLLRPARRLAGPVATALALMICAWLLTPLFVISPVLLALLLVAVYVRLLLAGGKPWKLALLLPVQLLWANLHGSFVIGPILFFLCAAERWQASRETGAKADSGWLAGLGLAALAISLVNPWGPAVFEQMFRNWGLMVLGYVQEWVSPFSSQFEFAFYVKTLVTLALLVGAIGLITEKRKLPLVETSLAMLGAFLAVRSLRHLDFFTLLAFPFLALSLSAAGGYVREKWLASFGTWPAGLSRVGPILVVGLAALWALLVLSNSVYAAIGSASRPGWGVAQGLFPEQAADLLARTEAPGKTVHLIQDGGYLAWRLPGRPIFVDQRADLFGLDFFNPILRSLNGDAEGWAQIENQWQPDSVLLNNCAPDAGVLLRLLLTGGKWALAYFDGTSTLLVRSEGTHRAWLNDRQIQETGLRLVEKERRAYRDHLRKCILPRISPRLVGAGAFYMALGRYAEAEAVYRLLVRGAPAMIGAWYNLGVAQLNLRDYDSAIATLERVTRRQPKYLAGWLQLGRAYFLAGLSREAEAAFGKARKLDAEATGRFVADLASAAKK